jgi:mannonate dehydratase
MKIFLGTDFSDDRLKFTAQIGADGVSGAPEPGPGDDGFYSVETLRKHRELVESYGLQWAAVRMAPLEWTYRWMLGLPGAEEQIDNFKKNIRNMAEAGLEFIIFNMHALRIYRTSEQAPERAGAKSTSFDISLATGNPLMEHPNSGFDIGWVPEDQREPRTDDQMWSNLRTFLEAVTPVAEETGVRLGLHPDDPPVPEISGIARIMRSPEAFRKYLDLVPSENTGVVFCQGCFTEMGCDVPAEIRHFGGRGKIFSVDFRNITGTLEHFQETFPETGNADMVATMRAYHDSGFDGWMTPDHAIHLDGDSSWGHRYWAYAVGHIRGLDQALKGTSRG